MKECDFESYHHVWLAAHPKRSSEWLARQIGEGFHIHHMDGDHSNDDPANLVLIESLDHLRLHGISKLKPVRVLIIRSYEQGKLAYERKLTGLTWIKAGSYTAAMRYAKDHGLMWPLARGRSTSSWAYRKLVAQTAPPINQ